MKRLREIPRHRLAHVIAIIIGIIAVAVFVKSVRSESLRDALARMNGYWLLPIVFCNFGVIILKALRWKIMFKPVKSMPLWQMFKILTIGFMANNILPARLGEAVRVHMLGKGASVSIITTTASLIADKIIEAVGLLFFIALLVLTVKVPSWMHYGLIITLLVTIVAYTAAVIYSTREMQDGRFKRFQEGVRPLMHAKVLVQGILVSIVSWAAQLLMIYMTQKAFNVNTPLWGILVVLISVNLAIIVPSAPAHLGAFELACVLAYSYLKIGSSLGLLIGATYHILQIIPVTLVGGMFAAMDGIRSFRGIAGATPAPDTKSL